MKYTLLYGNVLEVLPTLPSESIDLCITSPPYWGLRAYNTNPQIFGGNKNCQHEFNECSHIGENQGTCGRCGAWKGELGLEPTMEKYLDNLMLWVREVWRILKPTGSFVLNIGDCFLGGGNAGTTKKAQSIASPITHRNLKNLKIGFYRQKQLLSVSSFAYCRIISETDFVCRGEHIWCKPNVPSPIRSRLKHSHEKLFWFVKDADMYYFDAKAWMKKVSQVSHDRGKYPVNIAHFNSGAQDKTKIIVKYPQETIEHSWRIVPVGEKQKGFDLIGKENVQQFHIAPFPEKLIAPYIQSLCPQEGIVLDPFVGSGTTMKLAKDYERSAIGIDLNRKYLEYCKMRLNWNNEVDGHKYEFREVE